MEKYYSEKIHPNQLKISVIKTEKSLWVVTLQHLPSGKKYKFIHESQVLAYNYCLLTIESKLRKLGIRYESIYPNYQNFIELGLPFTKTHNGWKEIEF